MNLRNILKIYNLERQLSTDDVALLNTLRGMNEGDKDMLVESLSPQKVATRKAKTLKFEHCEVCDFTKRHQVHKDSSRTDYHEFQSAQSSTKSKRAKSLGEAIQKTPKVQVDVDTGIPDFITSGLCDKCGEAVDNNVHHKLNDPDYHEFVEGKSHALAAGEGS